MLCVDSSSSTGAFRVRASEFPVEKNFTDGSKREAGEQKTLPIPKHALARRIPWSNNHVFHTAFSQNGRLYLGGGDSGTLRVWDVEEGQRLLELPVVIGLFTPDGKQILGHKFGTSLMLFDVISGKEVRRWETGSAIVTLEIAADGKRVVSNHADKALRVWDFATGQEIRKFEGHGEATSATYSPDGKHILCTCADKTAKLLDADTGILFQRFETFPNATPIPGHDLILRTFFISGGRQIAGYVWGQQKHLVIWQAATGKVSRQIDLGADFHKDLAISPDGRWLLTAHEDQTVRLRDISNGNEVRRFETINVVPRALTFSTDGRFAASGSFRGYMFLWRIKD